MGGKNLLILIINFLFWSLTGICGEKAHNFANGPQEVDYLVVSSDGQKFKCQSGKLSELSYFWSILVENKKYKEARSKKVEFKNFDRSTLMLALSSAHGIEVKEKFSDFDSDKAHKLCAYINMTRDYGVFGQLIKNSATEKDASFFKEMLCAGIDQQQKVVVKALAEIRCSVLFESLKKLCPDLLLKSELVLPIRELGKNEINRDFELLIKKNIYKQRSNLLWQNLVANWNKNSRRLEFKTSVDLAGFLFTYYAFVSYGLPTLTEESFNYFKMKIIQESHHCGRQGVSFAMKNSIIRNNRSSLIQKLLIQKMPYSFSQNGAGRKKFELKTSLKAKVGSKFENVFLKNLCEKSSLHYDQDYGSAGVRIALQAYLAYMGDDDFWENYFMPAYFWYRENINKEELVGKDLRQFWQQVVEKLNNETNKNNIFISLLLDLGFNIMAKIKS